MFTFGTPSGSCQLVQRHQHKRAHIPDQQSEFCTTIKLHYDTCKKNYGERHRNGVWYLDEAAKKIYVDRIEKIHALIHNSRKLFNDHQLYSYVNQLCAIEDTPWLLSVIDPFGYTELIDSFKKTLRLVAAGGLSLHDFSPDDQHKEIQDELNKQNKKLLEENVALKKANQDLVQKVETLKKQNDQHTSEISELKAMLDTLPAKEEVESLQSEISTLRDAVLMVLSQQADSEQRTQCLGLLTSTSRTPALNHGDVDQANTSDTKTITVSSEVPKGISTSSAHPQPLTVWEPALATPDTTPRHGAPEIADEAFPLPLPAYFAENGSACSSPDLLLSTFEKQNPQHPKPENHG